MEYTFSSERKLTFIVAANGRNLMVNFGDRNENGVSTFMTHDPKVAHAIRKNSLSRRGIIKETTKEIPMESIKEETSGDVEATHQETLGHAPNADATAVEEREFDNYTVARETLCKEFDVAKSKVRTPTALAKLAQEHGIAIKYKEL